MAPNVPVSGEKVHLGDGDAGLTPGRIMVWVREEGYRAKAELESNMIRIVTGLAGYDVSLWCPRTQNLNHRCEDVFFELRLGVSGTITSEMMKDFINGFNTSIAPATVAAVEASGIIVVRMSFMIDPEASTRLFAKYFNAYDQILQAFRQRLTTFLRTKSSASNLIFPVQE